MVALCIAGHPDRTGGTQCHLRPALEMAAGKTVHRPWKRSGVEACRPAVGVLNMGSMNYAKYSRPRQGFVFKFVFANPLDEIRELVAKARQMTEDSGRRPASVEEAHRLLGIELRAPA